MTTFKEGDRVRFIKEVFTLDDPQLPYAWVSIHKDGKDIAFNLDGTLVGHEKFGPVLELATDDEDATAAYP